MKTNEKYVAPKLDIVSLEIGDVIANSFGHDDVDNWKTDPF